MTIRLSAFPSPRIVLPVLAAAWLAVAVLDMPGDESARVTRHAIATSALAGFDHGLPVLTIAPIEVTARRSDEVRALGERDARVASGTRAGAQCVTPAC
jgi:hypothetical protein